MIKLCSGGIKIPWATKVGWGVSVTATDGGAITFGDGVRLSPHVKIVAQHGEINIGGNAFFGIGAIIVCKENVSIGADALIAEYVVIRDQDHAVESRPYSLAGFRTSPITIGKNVWLGCKATVLRGTKIGDNSIVGSHSLVRGVVPEQVVVVGAPAKVVKVLP